MFNSPDEARLLPHFLLNEVGGHQGESWSVVEEASEAAAVFQKPARDYQVRRKVCPDSRLLCLQIRKARQFDPLLGFEQHQDCHVSEVHAPLHRGGR